MEIRPFKAFRFDKTVVGNVGDCISPPYDVISGKLQQQLYEKNEYNIVRIIKGKTTPSDNQADNQYTRAADYLNGWIEKGVLKQDSQEAIYAYVQNFEAAGRNFQRGSFISLTRLTELGETVKPHEQTLSGPKADRLSLLKATNTKFGLIFMFYSDPEKIADKIIEKAAAADALIDFTDEQDIRHRIYAITDKADIEAIVNMMADKIAVIADGHHRYETALDYLKETGNTNARYQMMVLANIHNEGMIVLATHRLVKNLENFDSQKLMADLEKNFDITEYKFDSPQAKTDAKQQMLNQMRKEYENDKNAFGVYSGGDAFYVAVLKDKKAMDMAAPGMSDSFKSLDVAVLHKLIIDDVLGLDEAKVTAGGNLVYVKDTPAAIDDSIARVDAGQIQAAFLANPPKIEHIEQVAETGEKMPQKTTYFFPKMHAGLTIQKL